MNNLSIRKMNELSKKKKKGFTLVELIIVIAIIAILAAIAIPKFGQITRNANIKADIATAKNIHGVATQIVAENPSIADADLTTAVIGRIDGANGAMPKTKLGKVDFAVTYTPSTGNITVGNGTVQIYPNAAGDYAS